MKSLPLRAAVAVALLAVGSQAGAAELEEIVVTAQKRSEDLQRVGIAISAFSSETLRQLGATTLKDVTELTPNVTLFDEYGSAQPTWVIRGVGLTDFNANNTPTAAIYVDDVYMTSNVMGGVALFDLQQVEVLKGPQGALYGRNTSGGAVRVVSVKPEIGVTSGYTSLSYGSWENVLADGAVNVPVGESAALRLSGQWNKSGDGWQTSMVDGKKHGKQDRWAARGQFLMDVTDSTELLVNFHGAADQSETVMGRGIGMWSIDPDPANGPFCAAILSGHLDDNTCALEATFYDPDFRMPSVQSADGRRTLSDPINKFDNSSTGGFARLTVDFGNSSLTSLTAYENFDYALVHDYDGSNGVFGHQDGVTEIDVFSQSFWLTSTGGGPVSWLVGAEYATDDLSEDRIFSITDDLGIVGAAGFDSARMSYDQNTESLAAFGQVDWKFADQWSVNLGARYTDETKEYRHGDLFFYLDGVGAPSYEDLGMDSEMNMWSGKVGLDWTPTDSLLLYGSVSKGFKSGGFFGGFPSEGLESITPYDPETVISYEIGWKSQWLDDALRFNGAVFYYDYRDVQGYLTVTSIIGTPSTRLGNIGDAEHKGVEFDVTWQATERLNLVASAGWLDAKITDSDSTSTSWLGTEVSLANTDRASAPDFSYFLQGQYVLPISEFNLSTSMDYSWRDDLFGDGLSVIEDTMFRELTAYGLLGARVALSKNGSKWEVALWGQNLTDEKYFTNVSTDDVASFRKMPGEPRSYGVSFRYDWE